MGAKTLTPKQEAFAQAYVETGNASEAYRRAGMAPISPAGRFYTYLLIDPRDDAIFYVGKGSGRRVRQHVAEVRNNRLGNPFKGERIAQILKLGMTVQEVVFSIHGAEGDAYAIERDLIDRLPGLTNIARGRATEAQKAAAMARACLLRMKSFDEWLATVSDELLASATRVFGSPRQSYDYVRASFEELAA